MKLTIDFDCPQLEALLELLLSIEDEATTPSCFYSAICELTDNLALLAKVARVQSILEHHANPLASEEFIRLLDEILSALLDAGIDDEIIEDIFHRYVGMTVDEFIAEYCQPQTPPTLPTPPTPPFLQEIAAITDNQDVLTAAANVWYTIQTVKDPYDSQQYPEFFIGIAAIIKGCGFANLPKLARLFEKWDMIWSPYGFISQYPELFID